MQKKYFLSIIAVVISALPAFWGFDIISVILLAALLTVCFVTFGPKFWSVLSVLSVAAVFCVYRFDILNTVVFSAVALPVSLVLGFGFSKNQSLSSIMTKACTACVAVVAMSVVYLMKKSGISAFTVITGNSAETLKNSLQQASADSFTMQNIDNVIKVIDSILPAIVIISVCLLVYLIFGIARFMLEKKGKQFPGLRRFSELRLSRGFTMVFLILMVLALFSNTSGITFNTITVVTTMFTICGLSCCDWFLKKKNIKRVYRVIIYIVTYFLSVLTGIGAVLLLPGLSVLGMVDSFKDFRAIGIKEF